MDLPRQLTRHQPADTAEAEDLAGIRRFVERHADPVDRAILDGHLTGSAVVVAASGDAVLLPHHRKLDRWLQPGGHASQGESRGEDVALRAAREETGLVDLRLHAAASRPLDVDVHDIPARPGAPAHQDLALRYLVLAPAGSAHARCQDETDDLRWCAWDQLPELGLDPGLLRAFAKARALILPTK